MVALALAFIGTLYVALALAVWRARPNSRVHRLFALKTLAFAGWTFGNAVLQTGIWVNAASRLTFATASLLPAAMLTFTIHYPATKRASPTIWQRTALLTAVAFAVASLGTDLVVFDIRLNIEGPSRQPGPLYPLFIVYVIAVFGAGFAVFVKKWRNARDRERAQLQYYGLGLFIAAAGGITSNLAIPALTGRSTLSHVGPYFGLALIALTAHAIIRHRFMDLRVVVHRGLTFGLALVLSLVPAVALLLLVARPVLMHLTVPEALLGIATLFGAGLLIALTLDPAGRLLDRYVYRSRANTQRLLRDASTELTRALDLDRLIGVIVDTIDAAVEPEGVAVYLEHDGPLRLAAARVLDADGSFRAPPEPVAPILGQAVARRTPLLRAELDAPGDLALREALSEPTWALALPLLSDERLVGLIAVGSKRSGDPFFSEDVDALATLANHAGSAVKNARLYAQVVLAKEYLNNIVVAMQNGVVAMDAGEEITLVNPAALEILRLIPGAQVTIDTIPAPLRMIFRELLGEGRRHTAREVRLLDSEGAQPRVLLCTASPLRDHTGDRAGAVAVFSDLTPLKELDRERARAESLANLQRITQALAHEIGNPLTPIKALAKLLPERYQDPGFAENFSRIVARELERIERLVARLRRVAPRAEPRHVRLDLRLPMRHAIEVIEASAANQETRLEVSLDAPEVPILGDAAELEELFLNLLTNALDAVADQPADTRCVQVTVAVENRYAIAHVQDSGRGIAAEVVDRIFDPFVTTKPRGSGLGLAICAAIAERHRGRITAANGGSRGTIFTVTLPLTPGSPRVVDADGRETA